MQTRVKQLAYVLAVTLLAVFMMSDADMDVRGAVRPGVAAQISHPTAGSCAAQADKQSVHACTPRSNTPPVDSSLLSCELGDAVVFSSEARFCGHSVTNETRDGRAFDPCAPARAGPKL
jgi:hypothetical protein